ncbi:MAG TPA: hypothetical protein VFL62_24900 [Bradyrhizobium sp.]|uniref:hypothetical protein n=1 Tax=Bradyrhizobium sp. TaxID=376 RepID=UPI002D8082B3|nr:hypothetical protein [Bradyrhizobium sp.]HET7889482.1 hypothetical protein [Bradyrhizobium sp.]
MHDLFLWLAGIGAIVAAVIHGVLGETRVFRRATIEPPRLRSLIRICWQIGTVGWICGGALLLAAPSVASISARHWIVVTMGAMYAFGMAANFWVFRGRHFGWAVLGTVVVMAAIGY